MKFRPILALAAAAWPLCGQSAVVVAGSLTAQAGNNGNPAVQQTTTATADGSYSVGPLSGPQFGGNSTQGSLTVASQPEPHLSASASGSDSGVYDANGATTFISASYTFGFSVIGPLSGIGVPLRFGGSSSGTVFGSGDASRWNDAVGTRLEVTSVGGVFGFGPVGAQGGTPADLFSGSSQDVRAAWGSMAASPVSYSSYDASFLFGATLLSGAAAPGTQVLKLATILQGGTRGVLRNSGLPSTGSAQTLLDAYVYIDPAWAAANPGYTLVLDPGVGVGPVPLPPSAWMLLAGLPLVLLRARSKRFEAPGACG